METTFVVIFTLLFVFIQTYGANSSINTMIMTSSNVTCIQKEQQSLLEFRKGLTDVSNRLSTWTGVECCEWPGVGCDRRNGHVVKLDLRSPLSFFTHDYTISINTSNWLKGKVSPSLLNLKHLRYLDLSMNNFSGQNIPEFFGSFKYLEYLNLSQSGFRGAVPPHLGNLSRLQYLDLNSNYGNSLMVKDDLLWVSSLSRLKHLDLSEIKIGKHIDWFRPVNTLPCLLTLNLARCDINIPSIKFINFTSLNSLDLSYNFIHSTIPVWLSNLTGLTHLDLHDNSFHGRIPDSIGTLTSLASIDLSRNSFNTSMTDLFWNLSSLVRVDLSENKFHGSIPADVKLCNLSVLDLSYNKFTGDLSSFIRNMSSDCLHNSLKELNLRRNKFNGRIPNKIGEFKKLESLVLSLNQLSGPIPPSLGGLSSLRVLDFSFNQLSGSIPESIGLLTRLQVLSLDSNQLSGSIPESIGLLTRLESLSLSSNQLSGSIPESIGLLTRLESLYLYSNQLSGNIPTSLGQLSNLKELDVYNNSLVGVVSEIHFTKLNDLTTLNLSDNSLMLNVSSHWIPPFQLKYFFASSCNIGPHFPNWLQTQAYLVRLDLSNSSIRDRIPEWFENISSHISRLDLSHNQIGGKLPIFHAYSNSNLKCRYIMMKSNRFEGSLTSFPSNVRVLDLSDNLLSGHVPHTDGTVNPDLAIVNLAKNRFTGRVPAHLCKVLSIHVLDLSDNMFFGRLPGCLGDLIDLEVVDLSNNTITGTIPSTLGSLAKLKSLHLHNNRLEGVLPVSLHNLTELVTMDLGNNYFMGSIPFWIGQKLSKLRFFDLQSNNFSSNIPLQLCQLNELQYLNLANNNIIGTIPQCFYNLSGMITNQGQLEYESRVDYYEENIFASVKGNQLLYTKTIQFLTSLDLSSNNIVGEIPIVMMNLVGLINLNLSRNLLQGEIPTTIGNLKQMESLDLSMNKLSGRIPPGLTSLNFLSYSNLSFNNLSGPIPVGNQLQTFEYPALYEGNNGLCGQPLSRKCTGNNVSYSSVVGDESKDGKEDFSFYVGMGPGFVFGFMGLIGSLYFIRIWRVAYFEIIENVYVWLKMSILVNLTRLRKKFF